jgi:hypothetical protein
MVVHRVVHAIEGEQFATELLVEILVAHSLFHVRGRGGELMIPVSEDVPFLVESIDFADTLRVHQIRGVPTARRIENDVIGTFVRGEFFRFRPAQRRIPYGGGNTEAGRVRRS